MGYNHSMYSDNNFIEILKHYREMLWPEVDVYLQTLAKLPAFCQVPKKYLPLLEFHTKMTSIYPQRQGKYVRPSLVLITAQAMGCPLESAYKTAAAMEMSEEWILIHDDIEDDSMERRGQPALHRIYGKELAINAGDALHVLMWKILRDNEKIVGIPKTFEILDEFDRILQRTVLGQTIEIKWTYDNKTNLSDEDILLILESKTGYYTIAGPMRLGALLAGATEEQLTKLYEFGKKLGYCFQIRDDLLDLTSDFAGLKKQIGNDIYEGKRTIMLMHLCRTAALEDKKTLFEILQKTRSQKTEDEVNWIINKMRQYGSLKYGEDMVIKFADESKAYMEQNLDFLSIEPFCDYFFSFIEFLKYRKY